MTLFFYLIIALITFFAFLHAYAKKSYDLSRTMVINASRAEIFNYVSQLKKQPYWVPWFKKDPDALLKFKGEDAKESAGFYWRGNRKVGEGTQKIIKLKPMAIMETRLLFVRPIKLNSLTYIAIKELEPNKSKIVWGVRGLLPFPLSIMSIFYSVDKLLGNDLEKGLVNLKAILESKN
ncbi:SRPBCC family protein [Salegentibacter sp.]|uniref:SRPBCC family protein n=1 Tax=Salegentibacter sp. TaxID=1903072 RepID=UPI0035633508